MSKCIIAGSRRFPMLGLTNFSSWKNEKKQKVMLGLLDRVVKDSGFEFDTVVSGDAWGIDQLGCLWATGKNINIEHCPADWSKLGKIAGLMRNSLMAKNADFLICIRTEDSRGSQHMVGEMEKAGKPVFEVLITKDKKIIAKHK